MITVQSVIQGLFCLWLHSSLWDTWTVVAMITVQSDIQGPVLAIISLPSDTAAVLAVISLPIWHTGYSWRGLQSPIWHTEGRSDRNYSLPSDDQLWLWLLSPIWYTGTVLAAINNLSDIHTRTFIAMITLSRLTYRGSQLVSTGCRSLIICVSTGTLPCDCHSSYCL